MAADPERGPAPTPTESGMSGNAFSDLLPDRFQETRDRLRLEARVTIK
jgi:hypothetical protein